MIVPICMDLIHFNKKAHVFMYLKYLYECKKNNWPLIVDEYFYKWNPQHLGEKNVQIDIGNSWLFEYMDKDERARVDQYVIPSAMMEELIERKGSRLAVSLIYQKEEYSPLIELLEQYIEKIEIKYQKKISAFVMFEKIPKSVEVVAARYGIKIIGIGKGPLRSPSYRDTGYFSFGDVYGTDECEDRYKKFIREWDNSFEFFDNKELLALFLDKSLLPYIKLYDIKPIKEMLIAGTYTVMPTLFSHTTYSDIEVIREIQELYPGKYIFRPNPADPYESHYHLPFNLIDKEKFGLMSILKAKNVASMGSNILFDTMLWGRNACTKGNLFPFSFMCQQGYKIGEDKEVPISFLNFFCFSYLIPFEDILDKQYLEWRLTSPDELDIFVRNLNVYLSELNIDKKILQLPRNERLRTILTYRGVDPDISISNVLKSPAKKVPFSELQDTLGRIQISANTENQEGMICSKFKISRTFTNKDIIFMPIKEKNATIRIKACQINGKVTKFRPCVNCTRIDKVDFFKECTPKYVINGDFSNSTEMIITWSIVENEKLNQKNKIEYYDNETAERLELLNYILNSKSWKVMEPLRKIRFKQLSRKSKQSN